MKKHILLCLALASWWTSLLLGQSPPPPPTPTKPGQEQQDVGGVEKSPTQNTASPAQTPTATINKTDSEPGKDDAYSKSAKRGHRAAFKWNWSAIGAVLLIIFNGAIAWVGVLQWWSMHQQAEYMRDGLKETRRAADAAKASAKAAEDGIAHARDSAAISERAVVLIESITYGPKSLDVAGIELHSRVIFNLKNFGQTIAKKVTMHGGLIPYDRPKEVLEVAKLHPTTIAPQGVNSWIAPALQNLLKADEIRSINQGQAVLGFHITAAYKDAFSTYKYTCTGVFDPSLKRFLITGSETS